MQRIYPYTDDLLDDKNMNNNYKGMFKKNVIKIFII